RRDVQCRFERTQAEIEQVRRQRVEIPLVVILRDGIDLRDSHRPGLSGVSGPDGPRSQSWRAGRGLARCPAGIAAKRQRPMTADRKRGENPPAPRWVRWTPSTKSDSFIQSRASINGASNSRPSRARNSSAALTLSGE